MESLFKAFAFGITLAVAVGPIALMIVDWSVKSGIGQGMNAALGASTADFLFALVAFVAGGAIGPALVNHQGALRLGGSVALGGIGLQMGWHGLRQMRLPEGPRLRSEPQRHPFVSTFGLTLINPLTVIAFLGLAGQLSFSGSRAGPLSHAVAVFCGTLVVQLGLAALGAGLGATLLNSGRSRSLLTLGSGVAVLGFAIAGLS
jgi:threonine/homoserine/homoserine lactone efflux protein